MPPIVIRTKLIVERGTFFFLFVLLIFDLLVLNNVIIGTFFYTPPSRDLSHIWRDVFTFVVYGAAYELLGNQQHLRLNSRP